MTDVTDVGGFTLFEEDKLRKKQESRGRGREEEREMQ